MIQLYKLVMFIVYIGGIQDIVAEWLRRWIANPLLFERVSSNLTDVVILDSSISATKLLLPVGDERAL